MTKLQENLYRYIMEDRYVTLQEDEAYRLVWRQRNAAEKRLTEGMTEEQWECFDRYMAEENHMIGLQFQHIFRETLGIVHDILNVSL